MTDLEQQWRRALARQAEIIADRKQFRKRAKRRSTYGPGSTPHETQRMHRAQGGRCANAACNIPIPATGFGRALDRDPATGKPLAILCKSCSVALGVTRRQQRILRGLIEYLDTHS